MKKTLLSIAAALLLAGGAASAQDWQEAVSYTHLTLPTTSNV